jgi:hypothetical protein
MPLPLNQSNAVFIVPDAKLNPIKVHLRGFQDYRGQKSKVEIF